MNSFHSVKVGVKLLLDSFASTLVLMKLLANSFCMRKLSAMMLETGCSSCKSVRNRTVFLLFSTEKSRNTLTFLYL